MSLSSAMDELWLISLGIKMVFGEEFVRRSLLGSGDAINMCLNDFDQF